MDIKIYEKNESFSVTCYGVGQGLFTVVEFNLNGNKHCYIFDCGGDNMYVNGKVLKAHMLNKYGIWFHDSTHDNYIPGAIDRFIEHVKSEKVIIDFIIISHMHRDHINGLSNLINLLVDVQIMDDFKIYLPNFNISNEADKKFYLSYLAICKTEINDIVFNPIIHTYSAN